MVGFFKQRVMNGSAALAMLIACSAEALASEWSVEGRHRRHTSRTELNAGSTRVGGSVSGAAWGAWGSAEEYRLSEGAEARYAEIAGCASLGSWLVSGGAGAGSDARLSPSWTWLVDARYRVGEAPTWIGVGATDSRYDGYSTVVYRYRRATLIHDVMPGWQAQATAQAVSSEYVGLKAAGKGVSASVGLAYRVEPWSVESGVTWSCLSKDRAGRPRCDRSTREDYREVFVAGKRDVGTMWGVTGRAAWIEERLDRSWQVGLGVWGRVW